jgi:hypothetical protein
MLLNRGEDFVIPETRVHHRAMSAICWEVNVGVMMSKLIRRTITCPLITEFPM